MIYSFENNSESLKVVMSELSHSTNLEQSEKAFVKDIKRCFDNGGFLSEMQLRKLRDLWEKS